MTLVLDPLDELTRRRVLTGAAALGLLAALPAPGWGQEPGAFPVTIEHKFGATTIPKAPERVISVGLTEQDTMLALGVVPVAVTDWLGFPTGVGPWAADELGGATLEVLSDIDGIDFERIAALQPDLMLGIYSALTQDDHRTLSRIAPTVAPSGTYADYLGTPWQEATRVIGQALGQPARADQLVTDVEERLARAREEHPEFEGAEAIFVVNGGDGFYYLHGEQSSPVRFLTALGFRLSAAVPKPVNNEPFAQISREQVDLLDRADVLVVRLNSDAERASFANDPLYQGLDVVKEGRDILFSGSEPLSSAMGFSSVLSLPFVLDELVPMLAAAVDGDPATEVTP